MILLLLYIVYYTIIMILLLLYIVYYTRTLILENGCKRCEICCALIGASCQASRCVY